MVTFDKVNDNKYIAKMSNELIDYINNIVNDISNNISNEYESYSNEAFIDTIIARKISSIFIEKEYPTVKGKGVIVIETYLGNRKIFITVCKVAIDDNLYKYVSGVLYY